MARKKALASPFTKGRASRSSSGGLFLPAVKEGEPLTFAPLVGLDELISADMHEYWDIKPAIYHPCIGKGCPGCAVGNEPRFKGYLPVLLQSGEVGIYAFTISVYNQLEAIEDALDDGETIKGLALRVSRKGQMKATRYTVMALGKRLDVSKAEVPDFVSKLGPTTAEEIWDVLEENGYSRDGSRPVSEVADEDDDWGDLD